MRKGLVSALIIFCFYPYLARGEPARSELVKEVESAKADIPSVPDINGWAVVSQSRIEVRVSDNLVAYLGLDIEYQNPADSGEFVRVISRHIPLLFFKKEQKNKRLFSEAVVSLYVKKEEQDRLGVISKKTDSIIYIRWRIKKDSRIGKGIQDGGVGIWFLRSSGSWLFVQNEMVAVQFLTENVGDGRPRNVFAGRQYRVGNVYHILKVDRRDLLQLEGEK